MYGATVPTELCKALQNLAWRGWRPHSANYTDQFNGTITRYAAGTVNQK